MRWICTRCEGAVNAPARMRLDNVKRYCLPCSAETGRLVKRSCPTLEHKRDEVKAARLRRSAQLRERARTEQDAYPNSLWREWRGMLRLPTAREAGVPLGATIRIRFWQSSTGSSGYALRRHVLLRAGRDRFDALAVLLHELAHLVAFRRQKFGDHWNHDSRFASTFAALAAEWGSVEQLPPDIPRRPHRVMTTAIAAWLLRLERGDRSLAEPAAIPQGEKD